MGIPLIDSITVDNLAKVNRRYYIVGLFNVDPKNKDKIYYFGPDVKRQSLIDYTQSISYDRIVLDTQNSFESFLDKVEPCVQEILIGDNAKSGVSAIRVGIPITPDTRGSIHRINPFLLLYKASKLPKGQELLKQLSEDVNNYLDLVRDSKKLVEAFNKFIFDHPENNAGSDLNDIAGEGENFHENFSQTLLQFLVLEQADKLDYNILNWNTFGSNWGQDSKKSFAKVIEDFRKALLEPKKNAIDEDIRKNFQKRRNSLLNASKTIHSKFMLSLLSYWVLNTLLGGKKSNEVSKVEYEQLSKTITSQEESERKLQIASSGREITLAVPKVMLEKQEEDQLKQDVEKLVKEIIEAYSKNSEEAKQSQEAFKQKLSLHMTQQEQTKVFQELSTLYTLPAETPDPAKTTETLKTSFLIPMRETYIPLLIGKPFTSKEDIQGIYEVDYCGLFVQAELVEKERLEKLRQKAKQVELSQSDQEFIKNGVFTTTEKKEEVVWRWVAGFITSISPTLNPNFTNRYKALQEYVRQRSEDLIASKNTLEIFTGINHAKQSEGNICIPASEVSPQKLVERATQATVNVGQKSKATTQVSSNISESQAQSTDSGSFEFSQNESPAGQQDINSTNTPAPEESKASSNPQPNQESDEKRQQLKALLLSLAGESIPEDKTEEKLLHGAENLVKEAEQALKLIWEVRDKADVPPSFRQRFTRLGLAELMLIHNETLPLNQDLSYVYNLVLDLMLYGDSNIEEFLKNCSLTSYFKLNEDKTVTKIYNSLEKQTAEAKQAMARFISEVRGIEYLFEQLDNQLRSNCEIFFYNGDYEGFFLWLETSRESGNQQFWFPGNLIQSQFIYPSIVYFLDSAIEKIQLKNFIDNFENYNPQADTDNNKNASLLPIVLLSPSAKDNQAWHHGLTEGSQKTSLSNLPTLAYVVGPAVPFDESSILKLPAGFLVIEKLLLALNKVTTPGSNSLLVKGKYKDISLPFQHPQVFLLNTGQLKPSETIQKILTEVNNQQIPLEGSLWLNIVALIFNFLKFSAGGTIATPKVQEFQKLFKKDFPLALRQSNRAFLNSCLPNLNVTDPNSSYNYAITVDATQTNFAATKFSIGLPDVGNVIDFEFFMLTKSLTIP